MPQETKKIIIDISTRSIIKILLILIGLIFLYWVRDIIVLFFVVLVIVAALSPIVDRWQKEMPRSVAVILLYVIILLLFAAAGLLIIPPLVNQIKSLALNLPDYLNFLSPSWQSLQNLTSESQKTLLTVSEQLSKFGYNILTTTLGVLSGIVVAFTVLVLSFYLLLEPEGPKKFFLSLAPIAKKDYWADVANKIGLKMGAWFRGQLLLMVIVGLLDFIGVVIFRVPYPLALGVWAALTEIIPYVGPWLGLIPAVIIAFAVSPWTALFILIWYVLVQQVEAQFLVPKIMGKALGLSPVIVILAILIGAKLLGLLGVLLAVPIAAALSVIVQEYPHFKNAPNSK